MEINETFLGHITIPKAALNIISIILQVQ